MVAAVSARQEWNCVDLMKAADASGGHGSIEIIEIPKPTPRSGEVLVEVECSAVEDGEGQVLKKSWVGKFLHRNTKPLVFGWNVAGTVAAVGPDADLTVGDRIWGHLDFDPFQQQGSYSEYVTMRCSAVAKRPKGLDAAAAASFATTGLTALQSVRDYGRLKSGKVLLVIGAGGGIGGVAVAIGKKLGAQVIGLCSTRDVEKVKMLGADRVIDRKQEDFLESGVAVDVILDTPSKYRYRQCSPLLNPGGTYVDLHPWTLPAGFLQSLLSTRRCRFAQVQSNRDDLELLGQWISEGFEIPVSVESRFPVRELSSALEQRLDPSRSGAVVVDVAQGW